MSGHLSLRMTLMDAQIVDRDGLPIGRVDDLELRMEADGGPRVARVLTGSQALGERLGGATGRWIASTSRRLRGPGGSPDPSSFDPTLVADTHPMLRLSVRAHELKHVATLEHWLASRWVERLPGSGHARK